MVIDYYTTAQVATLRSAEHQVPLQAQHIDGHYVALGFKVSVIFQANNNNNKYLCVGTGGGIVGRGTAQQSGRSRVRFPMLSLELFIDIILPAALWPWIDSASCQK